MAPRSRVLRRILVSLLVSQLGLAGTVGWLHLAAHPHAFCPSLQALADVEVSPTGATPPGVHHAASAQEHCSVLQALSQDSRDRVPPPVQALAVLNAPRVLPYRSLLPQRNPGQQPILSLAPTLTPPLA